MCGHRERPGKPCMDLTPMMFDFNFVIRSLPIFYHGAIVTAELSVLTIIIAMAWGALIALARLSKYRLPRLLSASYIQLVRNTPLLVQLFFIYFGFSELGIGLSSFLSGLLALCLQNGGYIAEIFRAGIQSVSTRQIEGARALGMTHNLTLLLVVLPQAFVRVIPPLANQFILIIKDTSIVSVISVGELMLSAKLLMERTAASYEIFFILACFYLVMTSFVGILLKITERRLRIIQ
jgi:polar amino acid transport system permease protein